MLHSSTERVRSRSSSLRASLRVTTKFISFGSNGQPKQILSPDVSSSPEHEPLLFCEEDLVDLAPEERVAADTDVVHVSLGGPQARDSALQPLLVRSRRSLTQFSSIRRPSRPTVFRFASSERAEGLPEVTLEPIADDKSLVLPSHNPGISILNPSRQPSGDSLPQAARGVSIDEPAAGSYRDPFRKADDHTDSEYYSPPKLIPVSPLRVVEKVAEEVLDPNCITPSPPTTRVPSISTITPSLAISNAAPGPLRKTLERLRSLARVRAPGRHYSVAPEIHQIFPDDAGALASTSPAPAKELLPELSFDSTPLSDLIFDVHVSEDAVAYQDGGIFQPPLPVPPPAPATAREQNLQVVKWQRVDPNDLTPSPYSVAASDIAPAETPLIVPSPSWLSRNTFDLEFRRNANLLLQQPTSAPASPSPLPIPNRSLFPVESPVSSPAFSLLEHTTATQSDGSSVTLYSPTRPILRISPPTPRASVSRLSVVGYRNSPSESRRSINSFLSYASATLSPSGNKENPLLSVGQDSPAARFFLLLHSQSVQPSPIDSAPSPLPLPINISFDPFDITPPSPAKSRPTSYQVYRPSQEAFDASKDLFPLPEYLRALIRSTFRNSKNYCNMSVNAYGKPADTVDWGDEVDYSNYEWFKNPPSPRPRAAAATPPPASEPYIPQPGTIEENEGFEYALKAAPSVLYGRFKQYGQLGVLAWCSEFGEMIDALKNLGFQGNMFISTRQQALRTCEDILALNLNEEIEMQIIVMYLSSQVARLRRFLDSDTLFEDYPQPKFPMDPHIQLGQ